MSKEAPRGEPRKDSSQPYEIRLDVPFRPYERARKSYWPKEGEDPAYVHENYDHVLLLRKPVSLYRIPGWIDVISEDPVTKVLIPMKSFPLEKPLGDVIFSEIISRNPDGKGLLTQYKERPYILRFGFHVHNPAEYAKLLNTYIDVELGKEKYLAAWNLSIPRVQRIMQALENGEEGVISEKNLLNLKKLDEPSGDEDGRQEDFERVTFVWLRGELKDLRPTRLTFHRFFDEGDDEPQPESLLPDRDRLLVRV